MTQPRKRLPLDERKKIILKSAVKIFARSNYRKAKMADIAAVAGVSEAMVYKCFPSKKVIFLRILQHMSGRIISFWREEVDKGEDAVTTLTNMGKAYYTRLKQHPEELKVQLQAVSEIGDEEIADLLRRDQLKYIGFIENVLKRGVAEGSIRKNTDTRFSAFIYNGAGIAINMMNILSMNGELLDGKFEQFIGQFIDLVKA